MLVNFNVVGNKYQCNRQVMEYLVFKCSLAPIGYEGDKYYFVRDKKLDNFLKKMPLHLKMISLFS